MKPSRLTRYALCLDAFLKNARRCRALGSLWRARTSAANAKGCYLTLRYYLDRGARQAVEQEEAEG